MKILSVREATVPVSSAMRNASIAFDQMTASALAIHTDQTLDGQPLVGWAFDSIGRYGKGGLLRERFIPRLMAAPAEALLDAQGLIDPRLGVQVLMRGEKQGGHGERPGAVGLLDAALWDLRAKQEGLPLWQSVAKMYDQPLGSGRIPTYASCGHFTDNPDPQALQDEVARCLDLGYTTVKIKLSGRDARLDAQRIGSALRAGLAPEQLAVDLNGQWRRTDTEALRVLQAQGLAWVEEPTAALDYAAQAEFCLRHGGTVATGENLFSCDDLNNLLRYAGLRPAQDRLQMDISLSYGVQEYHDMLVTAQGMGWPRSAFWPHAGHLFAAHLVAAFGLGSHESAPDATRLYGGFWDGAAVSDGQVTLPSAPGVGFEHKSNLMAQLRALC